ncbi:hypothetical protein ACFRJ8_19755 [Arthrobacter sp. NPDC056886]|uniref:hypothetical protein n=1 Tax=Arthrobacter sp. NPDC056886 TaxID=3345960 RepID=UPI00366D6FE0
MNLLQRQAINSEGLTLDQLAAADRMPIARALTTAPVTSTWRRLNSPLDLDLDFDLNGTD